MDCDSASSLAQRLPFHLSASMSPIGGTVTVPWVVRAEGPLYALGYINGPRLGSAEKGDSGARGWRKDFRYVPKTTKTQVLAEAKNKEGREIIATLALL